SGVDDAIEAVDRLDDLVRAGHLRDARRIDEADGLDPGQSGGGEAVYQLAPHPGLKDPGIVLETVARADVADGDVHAAPPAATITTAPAEKVSDAVGRNNQRNRPRSRLMSNYE